MLAQVVTEGRDGSEKHEKIAERKWKGARKSGAQAEGCGKKRSTSGRVREKAERKWKGHGFNS
jgi:hypothetical protein